MDMISVALKPGGEISTPSQEGSPHVTKGIRKTTESICLLLPSMQMGRAVVCKDLLAAPSSLCKDHRLPPSAPCKDHRTTGWFGIL